MAATRSNTTDQEVYFIAMIRNDLETSIRNQLNNYNSFKNNLGAFASSVDSDNAFLQPGKVFGNLLKDVTDTGNAILSQLRDLEKIVFSNQKSLTESFEIIQKIAKDKLIQLNDANRETSTQNIYSALIGVVEFCSAKVEYSKIQALLSDLDKKLEAASPATKTAFDQIKKQIEVMTEANKKWQRIFDLINQKKDILRWMEDEKRFLVFSDFDGLVNNIGFQADAAIRVVLDESRKPAKKTTTDAVTKEVMHTTRISKTERLESKVRPIERLHTLLVKKRATLDECKLNLETALEGNKECNQEISVTEQAILVCEQNKGFLQQQLTNIKLSDTTKNNINALLAMANTNLTSRKAYLDALQLIQLPTASIESLNKHSVSLQKYLSLFKNDGVYDKLFKAANDAIDNADKMRDKLRKFYSIDPIRGPQLPTNFGEQVAVYSKDVDALPKKVDEVLINFKTLSDNALEMMTNIKASKQVTDAIFAEIKRSQVPKPILAAEQDISQQLIDLRKTINQEESQYDADQLALKKEQEEAAARILASKQSVSSAAPSPSKPPEPKKVLARKKKKVMLENDSSEEEFPKNSIKNKQSVIPKPPVPRPQRDIADNNGGSAFEIAKYFQQKILAEQLPTILGGSTISVLNPTSDKKVAEKVTLPSFAATMASVFHEQLSRDKYTDINATRILITHLQKNAHEAVAKPGFFRHAKTQSLYHGTERDSYLLGRILNIDALHVKNSIVPRILALPKPVASNSETVATKAKMIALYNQVATLSSDKIAPAQLVKLYTHSASLAHDSAISRNEREYALHCMMLMGDVDVKATLANIKEQIRRYNHANAWGTFNNMPTTVREIFNLIMTSQEDDISQLLSIMSIARQAALSDHLSRSKFTQEFYQQLGNGVGFLKSATHYQLRYSRTDSDSTSIPNKGEIVCCKGSTEQYPWKLQYFVGDKLLHTRITPDKLENTAFSGVTPLSQADMIILGQLTKLPIDTQVPRVMPEPKVSCRCW